MIQFIGLLNISIFSLILLIILFVTGRVKQDHFSISSRLLRSIIIITFIGTLVEATSLIVDQRQGAFFYYANYFANAIIIVLGAVLVGFWVSYWDYKLFLSKKRIVERKFYLYPTLIQIILIIYNFFTKEFFEIEKTTNTFIQKPLYFVPYLIYYALFIYIISLIIKHRQTTHKRIIQSAIFFMSFPVLASLFQLVYLELIFTWPALSIATLVVYLFLETTTGNIDDLTKLYTRRLLELHLKALIEDKKDFFAIMIDLDHFKEVNDLYGHLTGDHVLIRFASLLTTFEKNKDNFIARLGGDEFFIVHRDSLQADPSNYIHDLNELFSKDDYFKKYPFLGFSAGYAVYDHMMTIDDILNIADKKMYQQKALTHEKNN